ncbi:hypothetical protein [Pseudomonas juntendi]|uniref:Uncharacterized protein n=1 Tax=Pseudomonas juntendi TaxID=2666183 RepID=A0ABZ2JGA7_9PSED|nr:hypothetical protein FPB55_06535 [Pseudomonas sp. BJP69]WHL26197.1 hypothetical protein QJS63_14805 [Pseudomonas juntendi]
MNKLLRHIQEHSADGLGSCLIVGAGTGSQLGDWRQLGCQQLLLAEAHPRLAEELGRRLRHDQGEHLLTLAVTADEHPVATLLALNNLAYSSLNEPVDLFNHYPNLRRDGVLQVPARSIEAVVADHALNGPQAHTLLLAAPGQALQLLQATPQASLHAFTWVITECSSEPLYEGDASDSQVTAWMEGIGFELVSDDPDAIFPQSQLLFERNTRRMPQQCISSEVAQLHTQAAVAAPSSQQQIQALQAQLQQRDTQVYELTGLACEQKQQLDRLLIDKTQLLSTNEAIQAENAQLSQALHVQADLASNGQAQNKALATERDQLVSAYEALRQKHAALATAHDEQAQQLATARGELDALSKHNAELVSQSEAQQRREAELAGTCDAQTQLANESQARLGELAAERDALTQDNSRLSEACEAQTRLANDYQEQLKKANEQREQQGKALAEQKDTADANIEYVQALEREAADYQHRQRLLEEELVKSEAQLELIKDLLLREPGL